MHFIFILHFYFHLNFSSDCTGFEWRLDEVWRALQKMVPQSLRRDKKNPEENRKVGLHQVHQSVQSPPSQLY
jgi:hypothetical protein